MGLAFSAWSINHHKISFTDVTARCDDWTDAEPNCPHAELWITPREENGTAPMAWSHRSSRAWTL